VFLAIAFRADAQSTPDTPTKPAEEVYKNIQIMKGVPAPRVQTVMLNLNRWLGVECAHCHVMGQLEKDDKPAKQTARNMFLMVRGINQNNFAGTNPVTCWTCHRGEAKPQSLPPQ
jgi:photosynthetic reaction center cytochrome c subunit